MFVKMWNYKILDAFLVLSIFKVCGLATFSVSNYDVIKTGSFPLLVPSKTARNYNILVLIFLIITSVFAVSAISTFKLFFMNKITTITTYADLIGNFFAALSAVVLFTVRQKSFVNIINRLIQIGLNMRTVEKVQPIENHYNSPTIIIHFCILITAFVCEAFVFSISVFVIGYQVPYIVVEMFMYQYGFIVQIIHRRFALINSTLMNIFVGTQFEVVDSRKRQELIVHLKQTHLKLHEIATDLANFCAPSFICCSASILFATTKGLFNIYLTVIETKLSIPLCLNNVLWVLLIFYPIFFLSRAVTECSKEVCILKKFFRLNDVLYSVNLNLFEN